MIVSENAFMLVTKMCRKVAIYNEVLVSHNEYLFWVWVAYNNLNGIILYWPISRYQFIGYTY